MKAFRWINLILILAFLSACSSSSANGTSEPIISNPFAKDTPTPLPTAPVTIKPAPDAKAAVTKYLEALQQDDYETMYAMLAQESMDTISLEDFSKRWNDAINTMSAGEIEFTVGSAQISPYVAEVGYSITYKTALVGDIQRNIIIRMNRKEEGDWKIIWDESQILPELAGGNQLVMDYSVPARGDIYASNGQPIVSQADSIAFGIQTDQINYELIGTLTKELGKLCGYDPEYIQDQIDSAGPGWYLPMCEGTRDEAQRLLAINPGGLVMTEYSSRYYYHTGIAPQAVGYTQLITPEQLNEYRRLGYRGDEKIGQTGIEKWAEDYLAGKHGGILRVVSPSGAIVSTLGQSEAEPADSIYLTLDRNLQINAQSAIEFFRGAIVIMEVDTGRILAMASGPDFDPNLFEPTNPNRDGLNNLLNDTNQPLLNRVAQGQYPLGSVFKIITMSAAMESGLYLKDTTYDCQYDFNELGDRTLHDWTWQHCQDRLRDGDFCDTSDSTPSGTLNLKEGLMRSCNPYFWHIGLDLFANWDRGGDIANMAKGFGLGAPTGIQQIPEASGQILIPTSDLDAVNQAIGQGDVQVTPLQVVAFMSAIANGGTLYRPQLVEKIQPIEGEPVLVFKPEARGVLPLNTDNLQTLREALRMVTNDPRGTARFNIRGLQFDVAGKTGTAESGSGLPHGWFAGFTENEADTGLPDIAIVVIVENRGEGSEWAVPLFRAMVESYYYGSPQRVFYDDFRVGDPPYTPVP